jgi:hypothetical protein
VYVPTLADSFRQAGGEKAVARSDVRDDISGPQSHRPENLVYLLPLLAALFAGPCSRRGFLSDRRQRCREKRTGQRHSEDAEPHHRCHLWFQDSKRLDDTTGGVVVRVLSEIRELHETLTNH